MEITDTKHLEDVAKSLDNDELYSVIKSVKSKLNNSAFLGFSEEVFKHLRHVLLVLLVEAKKRK